MLSFEEMDAQLRGGGVKAVSAPQLFPTPPEMAARMTAGVQPGDSVLEPSAGTGAILRALPRGVEVTAVELSHELIESLLTSWALAPRIGAVADSRRVMRADFLDCSPTRGPGGIIRHRLGLFDWVIANPPFTRDQDVRHIRHMWDFVKPGGRLITLAGMGWTFGQRKACQEFRDWLDDIDAEREEIPRGTFAGTDVATVLLRATKD